MTDIATPSAAHTATSSPPSLLTPMKALLRHEFAVMSRGTAAPTSLGFFLLVGCMAPLALGSDTFLLTSIAPGLVWILATLAALLGFDSLYQDDLVDGNLAIVRLTQIPLSMVALIKSISYWLVVCLPLVITAPVIVYLLGGNDAMAIRLSISLLVGTPSLVFIGGTLAAICAGLRRGTGLVVFLAMPFFAPALILGTRVLNEGIFNSVALMYLGAFSLQAMAICPFIAAAALRQHME